MTGNEMTVYGISDKLSEKVIGVREKITELRLIL